MAKRPNEKRMLRKAKSERNLNIALVLLTAGFVFEFYLLLMQNYYVKGTFAQLNAIASYLDVMIWVGLAAAAAGVALLFLRGKGGLPAKLWPWVLGGGVLFAFSSFMMRRFYPGGTTLMCVLVPVLMILSIIWLLYPAEFSVQATSLALSIGAVLLLSQSNSMHRKLFCAAAILAVVILLILSFRADKAGGELRLWKWDVRFFERQGRRGMVYGVHALCLVMMVVALFSGSVAFYGIWALSVVTFALAVYYTMRLM